MAAAGTWAEPGTAGSAGSAPEGYKAHDGIIHTSTVRIRSRESVYLKLNDKKVTSSCQYYRKMSTH